MKRRVRCHVLEGLSSNVWPRATSVRPSVQKPSVHTTSPCATSHPCMDVSPRRGWSKARARASNSVSPHACAHLA